MTNAATGLTDGTIAPGDDFIIQGDKLKIAPDGEDGLGVFYRNEESTNPETKLNRKPCLNCDFNMI